MEEEKCIGIASKLIGKRIPFNRLRELSDIDLKKGIEVISKCEKGELNFSWPIKHQLGFLYNGAILEITEKDFFKYLPKVKIEFHKILSERN